MEVKITLPDDVIKFVEFIPSEVLPDIIITILRNGIRDKHKLGEVSKKLEQDKLDEILNLLQGATPLTYTQPSNVVVESSCVEEQQSVSVPIENSYELDIEDEDSDLGDLLDLLK